MNAKRIAAGVLLAALLVWLVLQFRAETLVLNWRETYTANSREPYGTFLLYELIKQTAAPETFHTLSATDSFTLPDSFAQALYLFTGRFFEPDAEQLETLLNFVYAGNEAWLSASRFSEELMLPLLEYRCESLYWGDHELIIDTTGTLSVTDRQTTHYTFRLAEGTSNYYWSYFSRDSQCDSVPAFEEVGYLNEIFPNYIRLPYGEGTFWLHSNPIAFTNYFMVRDSCLAYAEKILAYPKGEQFYWDEWTKFAESNKRQRQAAGGNTNYTISPVRYILNHPALAWAWYLLLTIGLLFLVFRSKRTRRMVPLLAPPANSALEFITTIGNLYYFQGNHKQVALLAMKSLLRFVRNKYRLPIRENFEGFEEILARKSGVSQEILHQINNRYRQINRQQEIGAGDLMNFHQAIETFYHTCK